MNKKLFLSSSFKDVATLLSNFEENLDGKRVCFIPTASVVEKVVFFVKSGKKALEKLGLIVDELELSTATAEEIELKITRNDIIYVTGGNTFFLMQEMKRTGADKHTQLGIRRQRFHPKSGVGLFPELFGGRT